MKLIIKPNNQIANFNIQTFDLGFKVNYKNYLCDNWENLNVDTILRYTINYTTYDHGIVVIYSILIFEYACCSI